MSFGSKLIVKSSTNLLIGVPDGHGFYNLPSSRVVVDVESTKSVASNLFIMLTGHRTVDLIPVYRGYDEEYGTSASYTVSWDGSPVNSGWVDLRDILSGKWGLFARDALNKMGLMNRPKLNFEKLYRVSQRALSRDSQGTGEAVDAIIDEVAFLTDTGKSHVINDILERIELERLHADVISTLQAVVEEIPNLPSKDDFNVRAESRIAEIDGPRTKIRFGPYGDVRNQALKMYRKKAVEFGKSLRAGTLSREFPYMAHVKEAESKFRNE